VNQVNSPNPSQIRGALEIAGARAELVLANPSGIYLDGAGFINTSRATLTTGLPFYGADGSLAGYNVNRGLVTVAGAGLNASNFDQVDIISRAVQANAAIYAKNLNVIAGASQVNHDTLAATPIAGDGPVPAVAIDVAQLGGMYANRVFLVGNSAGVGVANAGTIAAQAGDLTLQNYWSNIAAVGDVKMPARYDADGWAASGQKLPGVTVSYSGQYHYNNYDNTEHDWQLPFGNAPFVTGRPGGYTQAAPASLKDYTLPGYFSTLSSNGTISGTGVSVNNTAGNASIPPLGLLPGQS
ncbi:filamentous hemagglutinin N-terminal domain-containing protein, partial [Burkholderia gladioli]|uniref:filamentous hemagglutinin N-terminal domain-containing protein n=1 Tax=Burkholderia gladioli TaxID=28095 RepID=UPI001FC85F9D